MYLLFKGGLEGNHPIAEKIYDAFFFLPICIQVTAILIDLINPWFEGLIDFMWVPQFFPNLKPSEVVSELGPTFFFGPWARVLGFLRVDFIFEFIEE